MDRSTLVYGTFLTLFLMLQGAVAQPACGAATSPSSPSQQTAVAVPAQTLELDQEVTRLKTTVAELQRQIDRQQGAVDAASKPREASDTAIYTALGVVFAALLAGGFAIWNQRYQAKQGRLLKAVEIIMESRSGYQADIRSRNLAGFLDPATKVHLSNIKETFSGPEFTDLHVQLAAAMSEQAETPEEVLAVWKAILKEKNVLNRVVYP